MTLTENTTGNRCVVYIALYSWLTQNARGIEIGAMRVESNQVDCIVK